MPGAARFQPGSSDPARGWRALAELVAAAALELGPRPAFAVDGPPVDRQLADRSGGPLQVAMAVDVTAGERRSLRGALRARGGDSRATAPQEPQEQVEEEHSEVWKLVGLAQQGDGEAFGQLYDRYVDSVYRFIYFRVNDRALAEDFTSETFLRALRRIGTITYQGRDIGAWFVTIARNIVFDHMKSARHRLEITTADTFEGDDRAPSPEAAVIETLTNERLMAAVRQLGDEQRECVLLRFIQGFSVSETAAVMGKNDGAIKALQHRAVRKLAELVGGELR
jgi:RNA polymerase sigma-70 factor, ECF subfamily